MFQPIIVTDFDGCLTPPLKLWVPEWTGAQRFLEPYKLVSDHDSCIISLLCDKVKFVILTADNCNVNRMWAHRKQIAFLTGTPKWKILQEWMKVQYNSVQPYYYLGDALPDLECMGHARCAFFPADASFFLKDAVAKYEHIMPLPANGGQGALEAMVMALIHMGELSRSLRDELICRDRTYERITG